MSHELLFCGNETAYSAPFFSRCGTPVDRVELARRGLMTDDAFYTTGSLFAVAAADDRLPAIEVGSLGPAA